jgi:hypothetical protein
LRWRRLRAGEDRRRQRKAELLRGLQIDDQLECGRLLDRQIRGLFAAENPSGIDASLAEERRQVGAIADQATGGSVFTYRINRRNGLARCQRHNLLAAAEEEGVGTKEKGASVQLDKGRESIIDLGFVGGFQDMKPHPLPRPAACLE